MHKFGVNTYAYTQWTTAETCVRRLADLGFGTFELMIVPGHLWPTDTGNVLASLRRTLSGAGITLRSLNTSNVDINITAAAEEMRAYSVDLVGRFIQLAGTLGAEGFILGPGKPNPLFPLPGAVLEGHFFRALDILLPVAQEAGVELWVENMPFAFLPDAAGLMASLERYGANELGICYDLANAHFIGEDPAAGLSAVAQRLALVHISDTTRALYKHDVVGAGDIDFAALAGPVTAACSGRPPTLEIIDAAPDAAMARSADALTQMGY